MADKTYVIRGYYPALGFRYWYSSSSVNLFIDYPAPDAYYPAAIGNYQDVVIYDIITIGGSGSSTGDGYRLKSVIPFDTLSPPSDGYVVKFSTPVGGQIYVTTAMANMALTRIIGVVTATDCIQTNGIVSVWTDGYANVTAGQEVYLSDSHPGAVTNTAPSAPGYSIVSMGAAIRDESGGRCDVLLDIREPLNIP